MTTKEEYEKAIKKIREAFYSSICDEWALEQIAVNLDFLSSLINEHFEEHPETNYEHYKDEIIEDSGFTLALVGGKLCKCSSVNCSNCGFSTGHGCSEKIKEWLASTYEKTTYKLTQCECNLLNAYKNSGMRQCISNYGTLLELYKKGYFKDIGTNIPICEILDNCEVVKDEKC
jgi:hypothetical protein